MKSLWEYMMIILRKRCADLRIIWKLQKKADTRLRIPCYERSAALSEHFSEISVSVVFSNRGCIVFQNHVIKKAPGKTYPPDGLCIGIILLSDSSWTRPLIDSRWWKRLFWDGRIEDLHYSSSCPTYREDRESKFLGHWN